MRKTTLKKTQITKAIQRSIFAVAGTTAHCDQQQCGNFAYSSTIKASSLLHRSLGSASPASSRMDHIVPYEPLPHNRSQKRLVYGYVPHDLFRSSSPTTCRIVRQAPTKDSASLVRTPPAQSVKRPHERFGSASPATCHSFNICTPAGIFSPRMRLSRR